MYLIIINYIAYLIQNVTLFNRHYTHFSTAICNIELIDFPKNDGCAKSLFLTGSVIESEKKRFISSKVAGLKFQFRFELRSLVILR